MDAQGIDTYKYLSCESLPSSSGNGPVIWFAGLKDKLYVVRSSSVKDWNVPILGGSGPCKPILLKFLFNTKERDDTHIHEIAF